MQANLTSYVWLIPIGFVAVVCLAWLLDRLVAQRPREGSLADDVNGSNTVGLDQAVGTLRAVASWPDRPTLGLVLDVIGALFPGGLLRPAGGWVAGHGSSVKQG